MFTESITRVAHAYANHRGLSIKTVSTYAANHGDFIGRLERGHDVTTRRAGRILQWFSDRWPSDLEWPAEIPRPAPREDAA